MEGNSLMLLLPHEMLCLIFSYIGLDDILARISHVCSQWRRLSLARFVELKDPTTVWHQKVDDAFLKILVHIYNNYVPIRNNNNTAIWSTRSSSSSSDTSDNDEESDLSSSSSLEIEVTTPTVPGDIRIEDGCFGVKDLVLSNCERVTDQGIRYLYEVTTLRQLELDGATAVRHLHNLTNVRSLALNFNATANKDLPEDLCRNITILNIGTIRLENVVVPNLNFLNNAVHLTNLRHVIFNNCLSVDDKVLSHLSSLASLESIHLRMRPSPNRLGRSSQKLSDEGLAHLVNLTNMKSLALKGCVNITDAGLMHLSNMTRLTEINLSRCPRVTGQGVINSFGSCLSNLKVLNLMECLVNDDTLIQLCNLLNPGKLQSFKLKDSSSKSNNISDAGLRHLGRLTALTDLSIVSCGNVTGSAFASFADLRRINSIHISRGGFIDANFKHLCQLSNLTYLNLNDPPRNLTEDALEQNVGHLPNLRKLNLTRWRFKTESGKSLSFLSHCQKLQKLIVILSNITDQALESIAQFCPRLVSLNLSLVRGITDAGIARLGSLARLEKLRLHGCSNITEAGLTSLAFTPLSRSLSHINVSGCMAITRCFLLGHAQEYFPSLRSITMPNNLHIDRYKLAKLREENDVPSADGYTLMKTTTAEELATTSVAAASMIRVDTVNNNTIG